MTRKKANKCLLIFLVLLVKTTVGSVLGEQDFLRFVMSNHPLAKQADLMRMRASAQMLQAKGNFDPSLFGYAGQKEFSEKKYYGLFESGVVWDSPFALSFKAGYQTANGYYLNPEELTPSAGLTYAGISMPLGQGLLIDKRRAALWQARIAVRSNEAERQGMLNNLLYDALQSYWAWYESYNQSLVFRKSAEVAKVRFVGIKNSVLHGEAPPIDTVEALIQYQSMQAQVIKWENEYKNSGLALSVFLWDENQQPLQLKEGTVPMLNDSLAAKPNALPLDTIRSGLQAIINRHPEVQLTRYKLNSYSIENRLYRDKLKPKLNLSYNLLSKGIGVSAEQLQYMYLSQNYKFGAEFSFPVFLRKERGDIRLSKAKINETEYALSWKSLAVQNKILSAINEVQNNYLQLELTEKMVGNYRLMLYGEEQRFQAGESSVFLVNSRQQKLVEAENKQVELKAKYFKSLAGLYYACGNLMFR